MQSWPVMPARLECSPGDWQEYLLEGPEFPSRPRTLHQWNKTAMNRRNFSKMLSNQQAERAVVQHRVPAIDAVLLSAMSRESLGGHSDDRNIKFLWHAKNGMEALYQAECQQPSKQR
jgi:hypothetical protein